MHTSQYAPAYYIAALYTITTLSIGLQRVHELYWYPCTGAALYSIVIMAHDSQKVASALNGLTDRAFVDALSPRDQDSMHQLIADFFCNDPETDISDKEEEETGKYQLNINRTTRKQ